MKALTLFILVVLFSCAKVEENDSIKQEDQKMKEMKEVNEVTGPGEKADVVKVETTGKEGSYGFAVTLASPDTGCDQYADWWEVVSLEGTLLYRRILLHSHVTEQPFKRSGGSLDLKEDQEVFVLAHMNNLGYGGQIMKGSAKEGFKVVEIPSEIDLEGLSKANPLPGDCDF